MGITENEFIWKLKEGNADHLVTWKILEKAQSYSRKTGKWQVMQNGEGPNWLHTPFSEQEQRTLLNLPTQEGIPIIKSETRTNKLAATVHQDLPRRAAVKWPYEREL